MFGDNDRKGPDLRGTTWQNDSTWGSGYHSTLTRVILYFFDLVAIPQQVSFLSIPFLVSVSATFHLALCETQPSFPNHLCLCCCLGGWPKCFTGTATQSWKKQNKAKQSKTQHLSLHWQHIKVTDWSLLKAINHHGCTPGKTPGWPWLTCTAMQLQKI